MYCHNRPQRFHAIPPRTRVPVNPKKRFDPIAVLRRTFRYLRARWHHRVAKKKSPNAPPLRAELFSMAQMETHGRKLAQSHRVRFGKAPDQLLARLTSNERALLDACELLSRAVASGRQITPAGEWMLDNFYLIEEQINTARRHLPKGYSWELPQLSEGTSRGLPRVYDIALETISHSDARVDGESIRRVVAAYQKISPLTLGELWAIPIMLRLALIENLRRAADRTAAGRRERNIAISWATRMIDAAENDPKNLILITADMARSNPPIDSPFVSELTRRLQGHGSTLALPLTWMQQHLAESGLSIEQLVQSGQQGQAADQVSVSNSIGSLRFLGVMDWREFVDAMSLVEQTLCDDPAGIYPAMDFATRDNYRHKIEALANRCAFTQCEIARHAIDLAKAAPANDERARHVGFYLIDDGLLLLQRAISARIGLFRWLKRSAKRMPVFGYLGSIAVVTTLLSFAVLYPALNRGVTSWRWLLVCVLVVIGVSELAIALINWLATRMATPQPLPRMNYTLGLPAGARTLVVVPTMLSDIHGVHELMLGLEVRFLANRDRQLHFALLTDFTDAVTQTTPQDEVLLQLASTRINELNEKYGDGKNETFFLLHRSRLWNEHERTWMGVERKRGKLGDLNALLRGQGGERFSLIVGDISPLLQVKYVITLDTDTQLPRDTAREFIATLMHPLNRAVHDPRSGRVIAGYGILQPRVAVSLSGSNRSRYARLHSGDSGVDPYTRAVSDVYQDLFDEGSFIGKGIYEVDAFERALNGRFPDNRILSHDLLEGNYARSGLLSDVQLYEDYPSRYSADVKRRYRWIRGDWQIMAWLLPWVPTTAGRYERNPLSSLSRWKILDNLRRSLVPLALVGMLVAGWTLFSAAWFLTVAVLGILLIPAILISALDLAQKPAETILLAHLRSAAGAAGLHFFKAAFLLACLPYEAYYNLDAIVRTLLRMFVTRRNLLEWQASNVQNAAPREGITGSLRTMWIAPLLALVLAVVLQRLHSHALLVAAPILLLWLFAPTWAWWLSRPLQRGESKISAPQAQFLGERARRTWGFFEHFVNADENWLPPDNFQEQPLRVTAHRTSPTNIGMALLANLAAHDFGYITASQLLARTSATFVTMQRLERYRGHFYNWYDTLDLQPLQPMYISTVDSGNLAGHLLTLRPGLCALMHEPILARRWSGGLRDTFGLLSTICSDTPSRSLTDFADALGACEAMPAAVIAEMRRQLENLTQIAIRLESEMAGVAHEETVRWSSALAAQCRGLLDELDRLAPWSAMSPPPAVLSDLLPHSGIPSLHEIAEWQSRLGPQIQQHLHDPDSSDEVRAWLNVLSEKLGASVVQAHERAEMIDKLATQCNEFARIEYDFLYDDTRHLLSIGYNVNERRLDASFYDLLASEARLCNFVAIAQGQLPQESWFALGRLLATAEGEPMLLSWSGSMFEYLMPLLVMPTYANSLLDQTYHAAVQRQIEYARKRGVPWGISESGYNTVDAAMNYQYRAFGVPGTGLKRGLAEDLVIAPYATALALMVEPQLACSNLQQLTAAGFEGMYGFYEAIDYTPARVPRGQNSAIVRSYMAHHQGMSLLSFAYLLLDQPMQKRFASDPYFQATLLLLQERIPKATGFFVQPVGLADIRESSVGTPMPIRILSGHDTPLPEVQLLSNGRYHVMVSNAGGGYSRWKDLAVTRWREDGTCDSWGNFCYLRDVSTGQTWSTSLQPTLARAETQEAIFSEARIEFRRRDGEFETHTEIVVSPEDDIELRRVRITNCSRTRRSIEITSYGEVVLAPAMADDAHPAFSNLFVQTEIIPNRRAILCTRRPRSLSEQVPWMFHQMAAHGGKVDEVSYETDRLQFIGRGNTTADPQALKSFGALSGAQGSVLDPIVAIRHRITLEAEQSVVVDIVTGASETREGCLGLIEKYQDRGLADRVFELAWTHSQVVLRQIDATESDAQLYARMASSIIYANASLRADASIIASNRRGQSGLWGYAISGDLPIVLVQIHDIGNIDLIRQMVQAHTYWRLKGLAVDLVIWNEEQAGYRQALQDHIVGMIAAGVGASVIDKPGGIFVRHADQIASEDRILLLSVARVIIRDDAGTLTEQINQRGSSEVRMPRFKANALARIDSTPLQQLRVDDLLLENGSGGFSADGREYVIVTTEAQRTPLPWVNVLANPQFGCVISESGQSYTWSENAHEFRLTPWQNDPVSDSAGEAVYLRDEDSGHFWSPTPLPSCGVSNYITRHGFGYSIFEHVEQGIKSELCVYVAHDAPIKFLRLRLHNQSGYARRLSATGYVEWVLADLRARSAMHVFSEIDAETGALFARNAYNIEFADRVAFFDVDDSTRTLTCDRAEFIGRNGSLRNPAAMRRLRLSGKTGAGLDPCAAIQTVFELGIDDEIEVVFRLGVGRNAQEAREVVRRFRKPAAALDVLETVQTYWRETLGTVQINTPDIALNALANGWLVYQVMACRLWARSGYYQSGGAFGFRDQLQDAMALVHAAPQLLRAQIVLAASRQFAEGDVQHWWHPPAGRGVRTRCSDDYLWLPLATLRYVQATGDYDVLDEVIGFIEGRPVNANEDSHYDLPTPSAQTADLYAHCVRAIEHGLRMGEHGLPLMGTGDWNDGMNLVGFNGRGESVWLGFFLYQILDHFPDVSRRRNDQAFAKRCVDESNKLRENLEQHAWDGEWYRRAYFDDGAALGSAANDECRIDSIAQSWSVLSGAGSAERRTQAMQSLYTRLVRKDLQLIQLLDPPFDTGKMDPGYIRGYVPGVRENGGQYTHAAVWATMAFAELGDSARAWELFDMINPINHALTAAQVHVYKVEPYVVAADVYAREPHGGRGGWTWYTGSAGWLYRLILESLLGLRINDGRLHLRPHLREDWQEFTLYYMHASTRYAIAVNRVAPTQAGGVSLDGVMQADASVPLLNDGLEHAVQVYVARVAN